MEFAMLIASEKMFNQLKFVLLSCATAKSDEQMPRVRFINDNELDNELPSSSALNSPKSLFTEIEKSI